MRWFQVSKSLAFQNFKVLNLYFFNQSQKCPANIGKLSNKENVRKDAVRRENVHQGTARSGNCPYTAKS